VFTIQTLNKISATGLSQLPDSRYNISENAAEPQGILVRSQKISETELPQSLLAIARAGAGTNNIPVEACSERGIVVFNTPGANANGVKELTLLGLLISSRKVYRALAWAQTIKGRGEEVSKLVEKEKSQFAGEEILGKKLGVIGLGAIGVMVANDARALGMEVTGYDPFISVEAAWGLSRSIRKASSLEEIFAESDYITLHVPLNSHTEGLLNDEAFKMMKPGVKILNFSRGALIDNKAILKAVREGKVGRYVTDFPEDELLGEENILAVPHLGASTLESEENCAVMAVQELRDYLEMGNIKNSVNYPNCEMRPSGKMRLCVAGRNVPNILGSITHTIGEHGINVAGMINNHKGGYAYTIIDVDDDLTDELVKQLRSIEGVISTRIIKISL
jgi:D-3-phosphoglycerate dehydrogenase